jgi:hypothetical protein
MFCPINDGFERQNTVARLKARLFIAISGWIGSRFVSLQSFCSKVVSRHGCMVGMDGVVRINWLFSCYCLSYLSC